MNTTSKIQKLSKILSHLSSGLIILLPLLTLLFWVKIEWIPQLFRENYDVSTFDITTQILGLLFTVIPLSLWIYGLFNLRNLFRNYAQGKVFLRENAKYIKRFAWMNILIGALAPIIGGVYSLILTMNYQEGERFLSISLGTSEIHTIFLGIVFVVIAHVMESAHALSEENEQFV